MLGYDDHCLDGNFRYEKGMFDRRRLPLNALRAFEAAALGGSIRAGADQLSVAQSAVSRHIAHLEQVLGRALFDRTPRAIRLTPAGEALLPVVRQALDEVQDVLNRLDRNRSVRIYMPPAFLGRGAFDLVRDFRQAHPAIALELVSSHETGIPAEAADIAIVFGREEIGPQVQDLLRRIAFTPMCLPELGPRPGEDLGAFLARSELVNVRISGRTDDHLWQAYAQAQGLALATRPSVTFATAAAAADYVALGGGVMLGDQTILAGPQGASLVAPFPARGADLGYGYYLRMQPEMLADPALVRLRTWLIERFTAPA